MKQFGLLAFAIAAALLLLSDSLIWGQRTARVREKYWYHTGNLLQNPDASQPFNPAWAQSTGNWTVNTGQVGSGTNVINSSDGSPWLLEHGSTFTLLSTTSQYRTLTLVQTVDVSAYSNLIQYYQTYFEYGGDAFAAGTASGSGIPSYYHSAAGYQASYKLEFFDNSGNPLGFDTSGSVFPVNGGCLYGGLPISKYGYRRTVTAVPPKTHTIRFTATVIDRLSVCYNNSTTGTYNNGFDKVWLDFLYLELPDSPTTRSGFTRGSAPGRAEKVKRTPDHQ